MCQQTLTALSHLGNEKANAAIGRVADENFAREVMQLFTIGLYQLNADGTPKLDGDGKPIETYTADDVAGLAKVFTGWSWRCSFGATDRCFHNNSPVGSGDPDTGFKPMVSYPQFHSTEVKRFLGVRRSTATSSTSPAQVSRSSPSSS